MRGEAGSLPPDHATRLPPHHLDMRPGAGARSRVSLGTVVFGGMLLYTILGVFFIPVLYVVIEQVWRRLFRRQPADAGATSVTTSDGTTGAPA